ncbi:MULTISPECIES: hypothetical protein [Stenotrophomonas]|nr:MULTISPECIES: hypothetical protein [Stenotrophomonas]MDR0257979.1 hypothetical protein [Stenotrophomonas maltophilia]
MLGCRSSEPQRQGSSMKTWLLGLTAVCASSAAMAAQPQMSVDVRYDWYGWGSVSEHWVIRRDAYGLTTRVQVVERPDGKARLPELLPFGAMAALDTALQTAPLTRAAAVQRIASRLDRAEILSLDPGLHSLDTDACSFAQQRAWARKALSGRSLQSRVDRHFSGLWTDDVPMMTVVVSRPGRPDVVLVSTSQKVMMLPWKRLPSVVFEQQDLDNAQEQWHPELSEAVIALLPEGEDSRRRFQTRWLHDRLRRDLAMESLDCGARGRESAM